MELEKLHTGANKHLKDKLRMDLVAPEMIEALAEVLTYGSGKYGDNNWLRGIPLTMSYAAGMRHMVAWMKGVDLDDESGIHHLKHAACNLLMMVTQIERGRIDLDNRDKV